MIIVLSGWRGLSRGASRVLREQSQGYIDQACKEVAGHLLRNYTGLTIRIGDCPTGVDDAFLRLLSEPRTKRHMHRRDITVVRFEADWNLPNDSGGPVRNQAMLDGDVQNPLDLRNGRAHQLIALPEPGKRKERSGTWNCIDAALERLIPVHITHLGSPDMYTAAGMRRSRMPLITPPDMLTVPTTATAR